MNSSVSNNNNNVTTTSSIVSAIATATTTTTTLDNENNNNSETTTITKQPQQDPNDDNHKNNNDEAQLQLQIRQEAIALRADLEDLFNRIRMILTEQEQTTATASFIASYIEEEFLMVLSKYAHSDQALRQACLMTYNDNNNKDDGNDDDNNDDDQGDHRLPIHLACEYGAPVPVIKYLLDCDVQKQSILVKDKWGDLPIHIACSRSSQYHSPSSSSNQQQEQEQEQLLRLFDNNDDDDEGNNNADNNNNTTNSSSCCDYVQVVKLLLEHDVHKQTIFVKDCNDYMPIHMACRYLAPPAIIQLLLDSDTGTGGGISNGNDNNNNNNGENINNPNNNTKLTLFQEGIHGQYPIHIACRSDASPEVIQLLLLADHEQKSVLKEEEAGRLPIHVYLVRHSNMTTIQLLLQTMIQGRMERLGLENWKRTMYSLQHSLSQTYERDFMTREKLDIIYHTIQQFMEKAFLLELAVWKYSCFKKNDNNDNDDNNDLGNFQTMMDINEYAKIVPSFDATEYKQERRIKSGADIIVRDVLPFLEGEPIDEILKQLQDFK